MIPDGGSDDRTLDQSKDQSGKPGPKPLLEDIQLRGVVITLMQKGLSARQIERLGIVSADTIQRHDKRDPEFAAAVKNARGVAVRNAMVVLCNTWADQSIDARTRLTASLAWLKMVAGLSDKPLPDDGGGAGESNVKGGWVGLMKAGGVVENETPATSDTAPRDVE
jgi:hypothetical protein